MNKLTQLLMFGLLAGVVSAQTKVSPQQGGTGIDTHLSTGCPKVASGAWTVNSGNCGGGGGGGATIQTIGVNNADQTVLNFTASTANAIGLIITPFNPSGGNEKFEITGTIPLSAISSGVPGISDAAYVSTSAATAGWKAIGSCSGGLNALTYNTGSHTFGCNTLSAGGSTSGTVGQLQMTDGSGGHVASHFTDNGTNITSTEPLVVNATGNGLSAVEGTAPSGTAASDVIYPDSTAHRWCAKNNNSSAVCYGGSGSAGTSGHVVTYAANGYDFTDGGTAAVTVASGTSALGTSAIGSGACATVVTTSATGVASTDAITFTPNASIKALTGYTPATTGGLSIAAYPTANNVNFDVCNWSNASITPSALTLNWRVVR